MPPENNQGNQGDQGNQGNQDNQGNQGNQDGETPTWEQVLATLPEEQRALYETHTQGLRNALQSERQQRETLAKQLKDATKNLEAGSQIRTQLEQATAQLEEANARADFLEDAAKPEIGCSNARLAWIAAQEIGAIDQRGRVNWDALRQQFPELFVKARPPQGNAGAGTDAPPKSTGMNAFIRRAAGRG